MCKNASPISFLFMISNFFLRKTDIDFGIIVASSPSPYPKPLLPKLQLASSYPIVRQLPDGSNDGTKSLVEQIKEKLSPSRVLFLSGPNLTHEPIQKHLAAL